MIKKGVLLTLILFLLTISLTNAQSKTEYENIGGADGDYNLGDGIFGANVNFLSRGIGVTANTQVPLVVDLDGDCTDSNQATCREIIIIDSGTIRIFNSSLVVKDTISTGLSGTVSNMISFDIDGDGRKELIVAGEETELIKFIDWNGTDLTLQSTVNYSNGLYHADPDLFAATGGQIQIGCDDVQSCQLHISSIREREGTLEGNLSVVLFNESGMGAITLIRVHPVIFEPHCAPYIKHVEVTDIDADGNKDYISTWLENSVTTTQLVIIAVEKDGTLKSGFPIFDTDVAATGTDGCEDAASGRIFSPPTVFPFFGGIEGSSESQIAVAANLAGSNTFKIKLYDSSGVFIDDFPEVISGEARLVSNVFRGNFFPDTQDVDFCATGYDLVETELEVVCGSLLSGEFPDTNRYIINVSGKFALAQFGFENWDVISHSTNHENTLSECLDVSCAKDDLDEVLSPYGLHRLDRTGFLCDTTGTCELKEVFFNPFNTSGVFTSVDLTGSGSEDLLLMTDTNLFIFDSLFQDQGPQIDRSTIRISPCIETFWNINTSTLISFTVDDTDPVATEDLDQVTASVTIYADDPNTQEIALGPLTSGTDFTFVNQFLINKTISFGSGIIRLTANDTGSSDQDIIDIPFSVAANGVELNDCTTVGFQVEVEEVEPEFADELTSEVDNAITTGILGVSDLFGGVAVGLVWLIIMALAAITIFTSNNTVFTSRGQDEGHKLGIVLIVEIILLIVGTLLGFIPIGIVITIVVLGLIAVGLFFSRVFTGTNNRM